MGPTVIRTERLNLRAWTPDDAEAFVELFADPEVAWFITRGEPVTLSDAETFLGKYMRLQLERGWCRWALELAEEPERLVGFCGVGCTFAPEIELGWTLRRDVWGQGLATEAARGALDYCFMVVGFDRIISAIDAENHRSAAVARRLGMAPEGTVEHKGHRLMRYVVENPLAGPRQKPEFAQGCEGEAPGSSFSGGP